MYVYMYVYMYADVCMYACMWYDAYKLLLMWMV